MSAIKRYIEDEAERLGVSFDEFLHPTPDDSEIPIPSCFTCKHVKTWHQSQTREEPQDSGWECNHPNERLLGYIEPAELSEEETASYCADRCPGYEFFDWDAQRIREEEDYSDDYPAFDADFLFH